MRYTLLTLSLAWSLPAVAQQPLEQPLAAFDKLAAQLKSAGVLGEPVRAGETAVIPFAKVHFSLGAVGASSAFGAGMGAKTTPLGLIIFEGDDVRLEVIPEAPEPPGAIQQLVTAILDHKITILGNAVNLGSAPGSLQDVMPAITGLTGGITTIGNGLNLGTLKPATSTAPPGPTKTPAAPGSTSR